MNEFLKDYVEMMAESRGDELTEEQVKEIVERLNNDDYLWEIFDGEVNNYIDYEVCNKEILYESEE